MHHDEEEAEEYGNRSRPAGDDEGQLVEGKGADDDALRGGEDCRNRVSFGGPCASGNLLLRSSKVVLQCRFISAPAVRDAAVVRWGGLGAAAAYGWSRRRGGWWESTRRSGEGRTGAAAQRGQRRNERMGRSAERSAVTARCCQVGEEGPRGRRRRWWTVAVTAGRTTIRQGLDGDGRRGSANAKERERRRRRRRRN